MNVDALPHEMRAQAEAVVDAVATAAAADHDRGLFVVVLGCVGVVCCCKLRATVQCTPM